MSSERRTERTANPAPHRSSLRVAAAATAAIVAPLAMTGCATSPTGEAAPSALEAAAAPTADTPTTPRPTARTTSMMVLDEFLVGKNLPPAVAAAQRAGKLKEADALLAAEAATHPADSPRAIAIQGERERLRRLARDFSLTPEAMREKIARSVPDVTDADVERWRKEGVIQWQPIEGEIRYFRREPVNLFRLSRDARDRRDAENAKKQKAAAEDTDARTWHTGLSGVSADGKTFTVNTHLAEALKEAADSGKDFVLPVRTRAKFVVTVPAGKIPAGETVRCWLPYPQAYRQQTELKEIAATATPGKGLKIVRAAPDALMRTVYFEQEVVEGEPSVFTLEFSYVCSSYVPQPKAEIARDLTAAEAAQLAPWLGEQLPHIPLSPAVRTLAAEIVGTETNPFLKARRIFEWINDNIKYVGEMEYCLMPSVTEKVLATRTGDCGVHGLLFVSLCRAAGVPARWQSGWQTKPCGNENMHDWAEFYVMPWGWLPADPSNGLNKSDDPAVRYFFFGNQDSYRLIANQACDVQFDPPKTFWRSDPVDSQRGEVEWKGGNLYYDDWTYSVTFTQEPAN